MGLTIVYLSRLVQIVFLVFKIGIFQLTFAISILNFYLGFDLITILQQILCVDKLIIRQKQAFKGRKMVCRGTMMATIQMRLQ